MFKFCKVADVVDWNNPEFQSTAALLQLDQKNRKTWEYIQVYTGLNRLGLLNEKSKGIGLGVGRECLIYAFTNVCESIVATDLYRSKNWTTASVSVEDVYHRNPFPYQRDKLTVKHMDMTQVEYPDDSFDFVWSCCSIEHVNSFEDLHRVYSEIHRILKPGGIAALTTEFNPTDQFSYEPNMLFTDRFWIDHWLTGENPLIQGFQLLDQPDCFLNELPENEPLPKRDRKGSIQVFHRDIVLNSIAFFLQKSGEFSQVYSDRWLPQSWQIYLAGCAEQKVNRYENASQLFRSLLQDESLEVRLRVAASHRLVSLCLARGHEAEAVQICQQIVSVIAQSEDSDHLLPLAHQCKKLGLLEAAHLIYQRVEQLPGAHQNQVVRSLLSQAEYWDQQNQVEKALTLTEKAHQRILSVRSDETHEVYFHLGFYQEKMGQFEGAIAHYHQALELSQSNPKFQENLHLRINHCQKQIQRKKNPLYRLYTALIDRNQ